MYKRMLEEIMKKIKAPILATYPTDTARPESLLDVVTMPQEHTHQWQKVSQTYAPPRRQITQGIEGELLQHALFGVTTYLWECLLCKQLRKAYALGSEVTQLDELLDKTELYGPQYFQREGVTYVLQRYTPAVQPTQTVPLR